MKNHYQKLFAFLCMGFFFILSGLAQAQCPVPVKSERLDVNNIDALFNTNMSYFQSKERVADFIVPKGSGKSTIYASSIWLGGLDEQDNLHLAAMRFGQEGNDFWAGPVSTDADAGTYYDKLWKVSREEIAYHQLHYADAGYVMPEGIANWPAHGRTEYGESAHLAPYKNVSGNNSYTPSMGDYPLINGDQALFLVNNDACGNHTETGGESLGVEILSMAYAYNDPDENLQNTIFLSYELRNKSSNNYKDFYFGCWTDFDIGYSWDDYIGCDTLLNLMYGYNGTDIDGSGQVGAYGEHPPAQGAMFLNQKMSAFVYHNNNSPNPITTDPHTAVEYYNFLRAMWKNGAHITYGGDGTDEGGTPTNFMFSGDPVAGTGWTDLTPGDRRGVMSIGPLTLPAGGSITVDIALPFARKYENGALGSVELLKQRALDIQEYYDKNIVGIEENNERNGKLAIYPNPSNGQFIMTSEKTIESIELFDMLGKKVFSDTPKTQTTQINTYLPQGLYMYRAVMQDNAIRSGKIVVR